MQTERSEKAAAPEGSSKNTKESKAAKKAERVTCIPHKYLVLPLSAASCRLWQLASMS